MKFVITEQAGLLKSKPFYLKNFKKNLQQFEMELELYLS